MSRSGYFIYMDPTDGLEEQINKVIQDEALDTNLISDRHHTFGELYDHRITLFQALLKTMSESGRWGWKSKLHSDGSYWKGWFVLGYGIAPGEQITYHLPLSRWDECWFAPEREKAPDWDGHTAADVLERLKAL